MGNAMRSAGFKRGCDAIEFAGASIEGELGAMLQIASPIASNEDELGGMCVIEQEGEARGENRVVKLLAIFCRRVKPLKDAFLGNLLNEARAT